jgi:hypothetical protein
MKRNILCGFLVLLLLSPKKPYAQTQPYSVLDNLHPVTPNAFQFTRYTELPVSDYTGIPNISIPLYTIEEDGIQVPLNLSYHSVGNRVNQEASWVGLGWDMQVGSIIQQVNDQDDYAANTRRLPDFYNSGTPYEFPFKYQYCTLGSETLCNYGCSGQIAVNAPVAQHGFVIYTDSFAPFNGYYNATSDFFYDHDYNSIDSEPDVFTASFLGHSFKFIDDWSYAGHKITVLNQKGYSVSRTGDVWKVLVPSGEEFDFELKTVVQSYSSSDNIAGGGSTTSNLKPSSIIWMLTKIITKNRQQITFNYLQTAANDCYPTFTQKKLISTQTGTYLTSSGSEIQSACIRGNVTTGLPGTGVLSTRCYPKEAYVYLSSIAFPKGNVVFAVSDRSDILGGKKLDNVTVSSATQLIKSVGFSYSYFNSASVGGNVYNGPLMSNFASYAPYRLKLTSIQDNSGAIHGFAYNTTELPAKNSYAIDYWGFYNGQTSNTSAVPNPTQFNRPDLGNSGDNHSANLAYCQAGILQQITYPTGGKVSFTYELNQFDNYFVPDFGSSTNTVSSGFGLRIKEIAFLDINNAQVKKTIYEYEGGKAILPMDFIRHFNYTAVPPGNLSVGSQVLLSRTFAIDEINMNGFFSSSPFSSINGVGYYKVTKKEVNLSNTANGKTISYFYNSPDIVNNSVNTFSQFAAVLPAIKNRVDPDNGTIKAAYAYDSGNNLLKKTNYSYYNVNSAIFYGARLFGYGGLVRYRYNNLPSPVYEQNVKSQVLVGYYPIYDFETLLGSSKETSYFGTDSLSATTSNSYNQYGLLASVTKENSANTETTGYKYPYDVTGNSVLTAMTAQNRLSDIVSVTKTNDANSRVLYTFNRTYGQFGSLFLPSSDIVDSRPGLNLPSTVYYDQYDLSNGNVLQHTSKLEPSSVIWDYNKEYVVAEIKNAPYSSVAYTSFEADGKGRWKFSGTPVADAAAPTGKMAYSLSGGNIYRDSLNTSIKYIVSYWSKSGAQSVNGTTPVQGYTYGGYTYFEHVVPNPASGTITVSGTGTIDELRLYPSDAQMTTCTYEPLAGITSRGDASGKITYYEYDGAWRLMNVRDQNRNIIRHTDYHYQGQ